MRLVASSLLLAAVVGLMSERAGAQAKFEWLATFDGTAGLSDIAPECAVDAAGNIYVAGFAPPLVVTAAYGSSGSLLWTSSVALTPASNPYAKVVSEIAVGPTGDVYVCGYTQDSNGPLDGFVLAYSPGGASLWTTLYDGASHGFDLLYDIAFDASGNPLVCGASRTNGTQRDALVLSLDAAGVVQWEQRIDGGVGGIDTARAISVLPGGEIVIAGQMATTGGYDAFVAKLNAAGSLMWTRTLDGGFGLDDVSTALATTPARIVAAGYRLSSATERDAHVYEVDPANGAVRWNTSYAGSAPVHLGSQALPPMTYVSESLAIDARGVSWLTLSSAVGELDKGIVTLRLDDAGVVLSDKTWLPTAGYIAESDLVLGSAGQAWVVGSNISLLVGIPHYIAVIQYDASGAENWSTTFRQPTHLYTRAVAAAVAPGDRLAIAGYLGDWSPFVSNDFLTLQFDLSDSVQAYCAAKTTSNGCVPQVSFTGTSSASGSSFIVSAHDLRNQKNGLLLYGTSGAAALPFQGGTLCVAPPYARTPPQSSNGNPLPANDCSGVLSIDLNAFAAGALGGTPSPALQTIGTLVHCQFWGRDPGFPSGQASMLSNALRYIVLP